jgi:hypothetical protein
MTEAHQEAILFFPQLRQQVEGVAEQDKLLHQVQVGETAVLEGAEAPEPALLPQEMETLQ